MKVVIGGQLRKNEISDLLKNLLPEAEIEILTDLDAALKVQGKQADYYLGACDTGGGGALAMAVSFLGVDRAKTIATQSSRKSEDEIREYVKNGVVAFGFVETLYEYAINAFVNALKEENKI